MNDPIDSSTWEMGALRRGLEQNDAGLVSGLYADDAEIEIVDRDHPPSQPMTLHGRQAIADFLRDLASRHVAHRVGREVIGSDALAFTETCQYPDGKRVLSNSLVELRDGKIRRHVMVQAWDG